MPEHKTHPFDRRVGQQIRLRRKILALSQAELGRRMGITFQQVQKYERGINAISARRLYELSQIMEVSPLYFYTPDESGLLPPMRKELTTQSMHLVREFHSITSAKLRQTIVAFVREIAKEVNDGV